MPTAPGRTCEGLTLHAGTAAGELLVLDTPLSFWGGTDRRTGRVVDEHHPQRGADLAGRVVAMTASRGSSSSSSVLAEAIRTGTAPAALLLAERDAVVVLGAIVAAELYGTLLPVVLLDAAAHRGLPRAGHARVVAGERDATVELTTMTVAAQPPPPSQQRTAAARSGRSPVPEEGS